MLKSSQGLGLSVAGGVDSGDQWPGLIRIKRLFVHQPAWQSGQLSQGDILLAANGVTLIGLTNYVSETLVFNNHAMTLRERDASSREMTLA